MSVADWLGEEDSAIEARRTRVGGPHGDERWGLALSGGGIRSSTFCLGLIKALARNGLLTRFDYLSTVSGGGYAGSALGRLFQSAGDPAAVQAELAKDDRLFWWWLRKNGRYLFPAGLRDSLFAGSTLLRGLTAIYFDLFLLGVLLACVIVFPHLLGMGFGRETYQWMSWAPSAWWLAAALLPLLLLTCTWAYWFSAPRERWRVQPVSIFFAIAGLALSAILVWPETSHQLLLTGTVKGVECARVLTELGPILMPIGELGCLSPSARLALLQLTAAMPLALLLAMRAGKGVDGTKDLALARNRLTRALMLCLNLGLVIVLAALLDMASWWIAGQVTGDWPTFAMGGTGLLLLVGFGRAILKWLKDSTAAGGGLNVVRAANIAGLLFAFLFLLFCATFVQMVVFYGAGFSDGAPRMNEPEIWASQGAARWLLLAVPILAYVLLTRNNHASLNASSLHNFYRARLTRSYLGVGNEQRGFRPNALASATPEAVAGLTRVSDVVRNDDLALADYRPHEHGGPLHLLNVCINQTVDDRTGEFNRDRQGRNMTVSSVGIDMGSPRVGVDLEFRGGEVPTLGQWVAISGAAAAPGMGANTSKGLAALLTLCGVRLGYWLDIARKDGGALRESSWLRRISPKYSHLVDEAFATFPGSDDPHWYASDGGHFENTGLYALLKREVEVIVAADCGADPSYAFGDLNNLVRLARIDFNARITFLQKKEIKEPSPDLSAFGTLADVASPTSSSYLILARVDYASGRSGFIVILKPALIHTLPLDLQSYKSANPTFPQQTTADQFFDEAQWESYFRLGEELGSAINGRMLGGLPTLATGFVGQLGTGLATLPPQENKPADREKPRFAGEVVKSSLGVGAVAGLLIALWQTLDQTRAQVALERRQHDEAIAKAIEKSVDGNGQLRVSDGGVMFLRTVVKPNELRKADLDYSLAEELIRRLQTKCAEKVDGQALETRQEKACNDVAQLAGHFDYRGGNTVIAYWAGSAIDEKATAVAASPVLASKAVPEAAVVEKAAAPAAATPSEAAPPVIAAARPPAPAAAPDLSKVAEACRPTEYKVKVYTQVYTREELEALSSPQARKALEPLHGIVDFGPIENVSETAEKGGTKLPYRWSQPTLIYHNENDRPCAERLAALYADAAGAIPAIRPLPQRLKKQNGAIELWVPPGGAPKLKPPSTK